MKMHRGLIALASGSFAIGVTEFAPMGMLPSIASDLGVSIPSAGLLISGYALGVVVASPLVAFSSGRTSDRSLLVALAAIFTAGNILSALSTSYSMLLVSRFITSVNHSAFFGVGSVVAARMVSADRRAQAVATMFFGLTSANVIGVPIATVFSEAFGWRLSFFFVAGLGLITMGALYTYLPRYESSRSSCIRIELRNVLNWNVCAALALTTVASSSMFTVYTYIAPLVSELTGLSNLFLPAALITYGMGLSVGNWLGGVFADRSLTGTLVVSLICLSLVLLVLSMVLSNAPLTLLTIFFWGIGNFALVPPLQIGVMNAAARAPNLAASINIGAFNLGNAFGATLGAMLLKAGWRYEEIPIAGAVISMIAIPIAIFVRPDAARHFDACS